MRKISTFTRWAAVLVTLFIVCACSGPEPFWTDRIDADKPRLLLKDKDFVAAFSEGYLLEATDTLVKDFTPFYSVESMYFGDVPGFSLFKRCIPPTKGRYTCEIRSDGSCQCDNSGGAVEVGLPDSIQIKIPPCKLTVNTQNKFQCGGNCKTGDCTLLITTNNSNIKEIGCACIVSLPAKYKVKNLQPVSLRPKTGP